MEYDPVRIFKALSNESRLEILKALYQEGISGTLEGKQPCAEKCSCVGDIVEILQVPQPRASRHLAHLRKANLVRVRKSGLWSYYSLASARTSFHKKLLECLVNCFREVPEIREDEKRAARVKKSGGCCPPP